MKILLKLFIIYCTARLAQCTPTVIITNDFDARADAIDIYNALHGPGTDESLFRDILPNRSCAQRLQIKQAYWDLYNDDISRRIARDTSGTYERLLKDCFLCGENLMASHFRRAITGTQDRLRKNKNVIEILVTHTDCPESRDNLIKAYQEMYQRSLIDDVKKYLGGDFENVCLEMLTRNRERSNGVDLNKARDMAVALNNEIGDWGNNRNLLDTLLLNTPFDQLSATLDQFRQVTGADLQVVISNKFDHEKANAYEDLIHYDRTYATNHTEYFATRIMEAVKGPGTDEQTLIRITLSHCETDMKEIEDAFSASYNENLVSKIRHDMSGAFENLLTQFLTRPPNEMRDQIRRAEMRRAHQAQMMKMLAQGGQVQLPGEVPKNVMQYPGQMPTNINQIPNNVGLNQFPNQIENTVNYFPNQIPNTANQFPNQIPNTMNQFSNQIPNNPTLQQNPHFVYPQNNL